MVMIGQIRAPATAALAASAANLSPKLRVFHCLSDFAVGIAIPGTAARAVSRDIVTANCVGDQRRKKKGESRESLRMMCATLLFRVSWIILLNFSAMKRWM